MSEMSEDRSNIIALDTSALLTLWNDEIGADEVEDILKSKDKLLLFPSCPLWNAIIGYGKISAVKKEEKYMLISLPCQLKE